MARVQPPAPTAAPTPPIQRGDRATFSNRVDAAITYLTNAPAEIGNIAQITYTNALDAFNSATAANTSATTATTAAGNASTSATNAASSAAAAAASASGLTAISTTSQPLSLGSKTLNVGVGKSFVPGISVTAVDPADATRYISGPVSSYSGSTLVFNATTFGGTGSQASWNVSVSGAPGAQGPAGNLTGGNLTGAINEFRAAVDIASASTPDVWSAGGNYIVMTGSAAVTGFPEAPQPGAERTVLLTGAPTFTESANVVIKGGSFVGQPGDEIDIRAETKTKFRVTRRAADGRAAVSPEPFQNSRFIGATGVFIAPRDGWYRVTAAGTAGQGGVAAPPAGTFGHPRATGGGAAAFLRRLVYMTQGQTAMCMPSAATSDRSVAAAGFYAGVDGGDTTVTIGALTLTAGGGKGGAAASTAISVQGGAGGVANGGTINSTGGRGGNVSAVNGAAATGGGALNIQGQAYNGGDITLLSDYAATGGAGTGGKGGNINSSASSVTSAGGGVGGPASDNTSSVANSTSIAGFNAEGGTSPTVSYASGALFSAVAAGAVGSTNTSISGTANSSASPGGAAGGVISSGNGGSAAGSSGIFAGASGALAVNSPSTTPIDVRGRMGGGSGGAVFLYVSGTYTVRVGTDKGWVLWEW